MIKKVLLLTLAALLALSMLTSCGAKEKLTADELVEQLINEAGYKIFSDTRDDPSADGSVYVSLLAPHDDYFINFYEFPTNERASEAFDRAKVQLGTVSGAWRSKTEVNANNHNIYKGINNGYYYVYSRIENTLLEVMYAEEKYKSEVDEILEKLGYK